MDTPAGDVSPVSARKRLYSMTIIRSTLAAALLATLPLASAHAQTQPTVTLTVTLTLTTPVAPTDTFSAFIGTSNTAPEIVLCGTGRGEGRVTPCAAGATITHHTLILIAAGGVTPYRFVRFSGPYGAGQRATTFARGVVTLTRGATITAFYRNVGPESSQRPQLTLADALGTNPLTLYADGAGFPVSRAVTVRLFWQGTPLPRQRPRYTSYTAYQTVVASSQGADRPALRPGTRDGVRRVHGACRGNGRADAGHPGHGGAHVQD